MKPSELRIGNWINTDKGIGRIAKLSEYENDGFQIGVVVAPLQKYSYENPIVLPIELTTEILEKCGFEQMTQQNSDVFYIKIDKVALSWYSETGLMNIGGTELKPIKFLHELQNRIFSLTGIELNINL